MRRDCFELFDSVTTKIESKQPLTDANILANYDSGRISKTKEYLKGGGTISAVVLACFDLAIDDDEYFGKRKETHRTQDRSNETPKKCRNDHELVFTRRHYCREVGLSPPTPCSPSSTQASSDDDDFD